jgi:hypothetical protein
LTAERTTPMVYAFPYDTSRTSVFENEMLHTRGKNQTRRRNTRSHPLPCGLDSDVV